MWFSFAVVAISAPPAAANGAGRGRPSPTHGSGRATPHVCLRAGFNDSPLCVSDSSLSAFCLPLGPEAEGPRERMAPEEFMFTLTQGDGSRVQGFCHRFLPPALQSLPSASQASSAGSSKLGARPASSTTVRLRHPAVLCLLCEASWAVLFFKVLEVVEQLLAQDSLLGDASAVPPQLPSTSLASAFLGALAAQLAARPPLGSIIRVSLPHMSAALSVTPVKRAAAGPYVGTELPFLECSQDAIELQVPSDCGTGYTNAGVALARLLWSVPVPSMVTLIASLLLERRVLLVAQSRDALSAAVAAANALLYPLRWHHIYLPLLPKSLTDYLTAPMPFLVGLPAQLLPALKGIQMDAVTMIDLDLGKCEPPPGSSLDDARHLPWREMLEGALTAAFGMLRSPTEHESNPLISGIMQGYFLKLIGGYRSHIYPQGALPPRLSPAPSPPPGAAAPSGSRRASSSLGRPSLPIMRGGGSSSEQQHLLSPGDEVLRGSGYVFDHAGLVNSHRRSEKARALLRLLRQSQMYEVFVQERLRIAAACGYRVGEDDEEGRDGMWDEGDDPFELRVSEHLQSRSERVAARLGAGPQSSMARFQAFLRKQRRTESAVEANQHQDISRARQLAAAFMAGGRPALSSSAATATALAGQHAAGAGGPPGLASGGSWGNLQQLLLQQLEQPAGVSGYSPGFLNPRHRHSMSVDRLSLGPASWSPAGLPADAIASSSTSASGATSPASTLGESAAAPSPVAAVLQLWGFDPAVFFEADDEEVDAADAAAAAAAAQRGSGRMSRNASNSSLSSLGGFSAGPSFTAGSGAAAARVAAAAEAVPSRSPAAGGEVGAAAAVTVPGNSSPRPSAGEKGKQQQVSVAAAPLGPAPAYPAAEYPSAPGFVGAVMAQVAAVPPSNGDSRSRSMPPPPPRPPPAAMTTGAPKPPKGTFATAMRAARVSGSSTSGQPIIATLPAPPPPRQGLVHSTADPKHRAALTAGAVTAASPTIAGALAPGHHLVTRGELDPSQQGGEAAHTTGIATKTGVAAEGLSTVASSDDPFALLAARAPSVGGSTAAAGR